MMLETQPRTCRAPSSTTRRAWVVWYRDRMEKKKDLLYKLDLALKHYKSVCAAKIFPPS